MNDIRTIDFWKRRPGESSDDCYDRLCDALYEGEPDPKGLFGVRITSHAGREALNGFLKHADAEVRRIALDAWTLLDASAYGGEETIAGVLENLSNPVEEVRVAALRCCRRAPLSDAEPVLLRLLLEDALVRERLKNSVPGRRSPLAAEFVGTLEALDLGSATLRPAVFPRSSSGATSLLRRVTRRSCLLRTPTWLRPAPLAAEASGTWRSFGRPTVPTTGRRRAFRSTTA